MNNLTITFYQQDIVWGDAEANRRRVEKALASAPKSDIFVYIESFLNFIYIKFYFFRFFN